MSRNPFMQAPDIHAGGLVPMVIEQSTHVSAPTTSIHAS